jgi:hypothetical protein
MKLLKNTYIGFLLFISVGCTNDDKIQPLRIKIETEKSNSLTWFEMGTATNPDGITMKISSQGMYLGDKPVLPVMGEFHYARFPETEWRKELLKMKAGGINIIASYIFWIHHEEIEGKFRWDGQRNLRHFIELCQELKLPIVLRVGSWCHGECRNGGLPDWLVTSSIKVRQDNPAYLKKVQIFFNQIFEQANGLLWKDGGPVIGVQIENEYGGYAEHLMTLKSILQETGFDVPLYTRTGWPNLSSSIPFGEIIPLYGDYPDGFWDRSTEELTGDYNKGYSFQAFRSSTVIATEQLQKQFKSINPDDLAYPYFTCELGGGMMPGYHRRINIAPMDVAAMSMVKVGSGSNLPGYYMYHGGTNPDGEKTTLNEMQSTPYTNYNDLPVKTYDFQAPLGEFGQVNPHYHLLRRLHIFLHDFGSEMTSMYAWFPEPSGQADSLRWAVRSNGTSGYLFVNNYQRLTPMSPKASVKFALDLAERELIFPNEPFTVPADAAFFMPFNMNMGSVRMIYSTTQPLSKLESETEIIYIFASIAGVTPEFVFDKNGLELQSSNVKASKQGNHLVFNNLKTGTDAAISFLDEDNKTIRIVLLDEDSSLTFWKGELAGKERFFLTSSNLTYHDNCLELTAETGKAQTVAIYPAPQSLIHAGKTIPGNPKGIFIEYKIEIPAPQKIKTELIKIADAQLPLREIKMGGAKVAEQPSDADFNKAAVWKIELPAIKDTTRDIFLNMKYVGDVARIYLDGKLLTDNFYNGKNFLLGLKRFAPAIYEGELLIKILPFQKEAPIYLPVRKQMEELEYSILANIFGIEVSENVIAELEIK